MPATATLIEYTGKGRHDEARHAANILAFTKSTRLELTPGLLAEIQLLDAEEMATRLAYMATTIRSSWEFVDVTFLLTGVTRACAQQITRTRTASFAMQSLRVVDARGIGITNPCLHNSEGAPHLGTIKFRDAANIARKTYTELVDAGVPTEDARGILPLNTTCNLVAKYNLRNFVDLVAARKSLRTQSEYGTLVREMEAEVLAVWPWATPFFAHRLQSAIDVLEECVREVGLTTGSGVGWKVAKAIDLLRGDA
jgi:flavin-dependent thymidylate synthase